MRQLSPSRVTLARGQIALAWALAKAHQLSDADQLLEDAAALLGGNEQSSEYADLLITRGYTASVRERYHDALVCFRNASKIYKAGSGNGQHLFLAAKTWEGRIAHTLGDVKTAEERYFSALCEAEAILPDNHALIGGIRCGLGELYLDIGLNSAAKDQLERALKIASSAFGADSIEVAEVLFHLVRLSSADRSLSEGYSRRAIEIIRLQSGDAMEDFRIRWLRIVNLLVQGKSGYTDAIELLQASCSDNEILASTQCFSHLVAKQMLSILLCATGRTSEGVELARDVICTERVLLGKEHFAFNLSRMMLAYDLSINGKYREAWTLLQEAIDASTDVEMLRTSALSESERTRYLEQLDPLLAGC